MKRTTKGVLIILIAIISSCKTTEFRDRDFSYRQEINDSTALSTLLEIESKFLYAAFDSLLLKVSKENYLQELELKINSTNNDSFKEALQKVGNIISNEFLNSDSINLDQVKTTPEIKKSELLWNPIFGLAEKGKIFVYDKTDKKLQDSIWKKSYYRERLKQDGIRTKFFEGNIYTTKKGKVLLEIGLKSGT